MRFLGYEEPTQHLFYSFFVFLIGAVVTWAIT